MKHLLPAAVLLVLTGPAFCDDLVDFGREIAETNCAPCHAIGSSGASPHREAPRFRDLSSRYPIEALEEAFAEGIVVGHEDMPVFKPNPEQATALLAYLESIQPH